jgi:cobalt-zinc-cadmium efflux system membrane fusion protein
MTFARWRGSLVLALATAVLAVGCGPTDHKDGPAKGKRKQPQEKAVAAEGHDHSGWWCDEHGIPEEICGQCNAKYAAECKKKGDWCKEHDRPDSQCFLCHPELKEKFAAQYRAKYGKEPPPTEDDEGKKDETRNEKKS